MRCFIALPLPSPAREALARALSPIRGRWPRLRWVGSEGYHLTLAFLGEIGEQAVEQARRAVRAAAAGERSFRLSFSDYGFLPPRGAPRVFIAEVEEEPAGASARLYRRVFEALEADTRGAASPAGLGTVPAGSPFALDSRPYRAHVTLARMNPGAPGPDRAALGRYSADAAFPRTPWTIDRCVLYKSDLRRGGAVYTEIERVALV